MLSPYSNQGEERPAFNICNCEVCYEKGKNKHLTEEKLKSLVKEDSAVGFYEDSVESFVNGKQELTPCDMFSIDNGNDELGSVAKLIFNIRPENPLLSFELNTDIHDSDEDSFYISLGYFGISKTISDLQKLCKGTPQDIQKCLKIAESKEYLEKYKNRWSKHDFNRLTKFAVAFFK